jgi:hypothetical protein
VTIRLYTGDEVHGFMLPDYRSDEPRWIDAKTGLIPLIEGLAAYDCIRDEPNCGSCLSCQAKTLLGPRDPISVHKSEPEHQAQMKWARDMVSKVIIQPADDFALQNISEQK